jgi:hypothetical protein
MKSNMIIGGLLFTSIIVLSMFVNTLEYFNSPDSIVTSIQTLKHAFNSLQQPVIVSRSIDTPKGKMVVGEVIKVNLVNISTLEKTYSKMLSGPQSYDSQNIRNTVQKSINELIERYNSIVKTLGLKMPEFKDIKIVVSGLKTATETAINNTKIDPVLIALQNVQDSFMSIREEIIRSGSRSIYTPKGEISALKMVEENVNNINALTEKYILMLQDKKTNTSAKNFVQDNLNVFITTYNYIITSLKLKRQLLPKNMIDIKGELIDKPKVNDPIPGLSANTVLTIPLGQLFGTQQLITQMSSHGLDAPPNLFNSPSSIKVPAPPTMATKAAAKAKLTPEIPKPLPEKYIFTKLSKIYDTLPTQNSMLD